MLLYMKQKVIFYGAGAICQMLLSYNKRYDLFDIIAIIDDCSKNEDLIHGIPKMDFETFCKIYSNENKISIIVTIGYTNCNIHREDICKRIRDNGYTLINFISPGAHVWEDTICGENIIILDNVFIGMGSKINDGVMIMPGCVLAHDVYVGEYTFFSNAAVAGGNTIIGKNSFVGLNATIKSRIVVGEYNIVGAAANVIHSTGSNSVIKGNPGVSTIKDTIHMKI